MTLRCAVAAQAGSDEEAVAHPPGFDGFLPEKPPPFSADRPAIMAGCPAQPHAGAASTRSQAVGA